MFVSQDVAIFLKYHMSVFAVYHFSFEFQNKLKKKNCKKFNLEKLLFSHLPQKNQLFSTETPKTVVGEVISPIFVKYWTYLTLTVGQLTSYIA